MGASASATSLIGAQSQPAGTTSLGVSISHCLGFGAVCVDADEFRAAIPESQWAKTFPQVLKDWVQQPAGQFDTDAGTERAIASWEEKVQAFFQASAPSESSSARSEQKLVRAANMCFVLSVDNSMMATLGLKLGDYVADRLVGMLCSGETRYWDLDGDVACVGGQILPNKRSGILASASESRRWEVPTVTLTTKVLYIFADQDPVR